MLKSVVVSLPLVLFFILNLKIGTSTFDVFEKREKNLQIHQTSSNQTNLTTEVHIKSYKDPTPEVLSSQKLSLEKVEKLQREVFQYSNPSSFRPEKLVDIILLEITQNLVVKKIGCQKFTRLE